MNQDEKDLLKMLIDNLGDNIKLNKLVSINLELINKRLDKVEKDIINIKRLKLVK